MFSLNVVQFTLYFQIHFTSSSLNTINTIAGEGHVLCVLSSCPRLKVLHLAMNELTVIEEWFVPRLYNQFQ